MLKANQQNLVDLHDYVKKSFTDYIAESAIERDELTLHCSPEHLFSLAQWLKNNRLCLFEMLIDICGVDYPAREKRFSVVTHLCSLKHNMRVRLKVNIDEDTILPSLSPLWPAAGWFERECWDMYGIFFKNHPDLRRILSDYGFQGHALRKDFPLSGHTQMRYDEEQRRVIYEPVDLVQEYRSFDFMSPWEGPLPGDEKAGEQVGKPAKPENGSTP